MINYELNLVSLIYNNLAGNSISYAIWHIISNYSIVILAILLILYSIKESEIRILLSSILAIIIGYLVKYIIEQFYFRIRPENVLGFTNTRNDSSFFSMHSLSVFIIAFSCIYYEKKLTNRIMIILIAIITAVSRIVLARHYISDVLFGFVLALFYYYIISR